MKLDKKYLAKVIPDYFWHNEFRRQGYTFLICVIISVFIWLMIKLSDDYYDTINCKINYVNIPEGKTILNSSDTTISLRLYARGFRLFSLKYMNSRPEITVNLQKTKLHKSRYTYSSYILTRPFIQSIKDELDIANEIESIYPDTLSFVLEDIISKKVPVVHKLQFSFAKQYQQYGNLKVSPDSITIKGLPSRIDTIRKIFTESKELADISKSRSVTLLLEKPLKTKSFFMSSDTVNVFIPVEKFTEASIEIPIEIKDEQESKIKLFPDKVNITYLVALKDYDKVGQDMFDAVVSPGHSKLNSRTLSVELERHPVFIKIKQINPSKVEFIILKQ